MIKEIDTGEVLDDETIELKASDQARAISADEHHIMADPKMFAKHINKLEKKCSRLQRTTV